MSLIFLIIFVDIIYFSIIYLTIYLIYIFLIIYLSITYLSIYLIILLFLYMYILINHLSYLIIIAVLGSETSLWPVLPCLSVGHYLLKGREVSLLSSYLSNYHISIRHLSFNLSHYYCCYAARVPLQIWYQWILFNPITDISLTRRKFGYNLGWWEKCNPCSNK